MDLRRTHTTILNQGEPEEKRSEILQYFYVPIWLLQLPGKFYT